MAGAASCVRDVRPPFASPAPSMWDDLLSAISMDHQISEKYAQDIESLKKGARSLLMAATSTKLMILVDKIVRLGLTYHFETEIEDKLCELHIFGEDDEDYDLFTTALRFRLLRQHQYHVSCNVFDKFVDKDKKLEGTLSSDVEGLLSLYEAAQVRIHDENILEEAVIFTIHHLTRLLPQLESRLKDRVQHALEHPLHRSVLIINVPFHISIYERDDSGNELLLKLAKLNFNFLQNMYRKEISELSRWWKEFDLKSKLPLPYVRDRIVESYFWGTAFHFEPQYSYVREIVAKNLQMLTIIDDTYDNYATLEEAELFTQILERWNVNEIDLLPDYMKVVYRCIMSISEDCEREAAKQERSFVVPCYRESVKQLARAYNQEQKWIMERSMPSFEEYITNSVITSCIYLMFTALVPGLRSATKDTVDWLLSDTKLVISTAKMGRHLQDLGSHERENREGKLLTVVDCYMKDRDVSKQEALSKFVELVEYGWKDINKEWSERTTSTPKEMAELLLNYARAAEVTYKNSEDGFTYPEKLAPHITALLMDPVLV